MGVDAGEVDGSAGELVLEAGLRQDAAAGSAQAAAVDALRDGALYSGPGLVAVLPGVGVLVGAGLAECSVFFAGPQGQASAEAGGGALLMDRAGPALADVEADPDNRGAFG